MRTLKNPGAKRTVAGIGTFVVLAFASVAGAMQEYEDLKTYLAEVDADIQEAAQEVHDLEVLDILQSIFGTEQLSEILDQVDRLECQASCAISAAGADATGDFEVRKQMQDIKQAAQEVRNRVLEIRVRLVPLATYPPYLPMWQHGGWGEIRA